MSKSNLIIFLINFGILEKCIGRKNVQIEKVITKWLPNMMYISSQIASCTISYKLVLQMANYVQN